MAGSTQAEIIAIGEELVSGQRLDTNSQWLSQQLSDQGIPVRWHTTVGDDLDDHVEAIRIAARRADIVVMTGGLGPTADDLTREAMARSAEVPLQLDQQQLAHIEGLFRRRGRKMPERNRLQAMFPAGSRPVHNPHGSAPGIEMVLTLSGSDPCRLIALPGVPAEMREMWELSGHPLVARMTGHASQIITHRRLKCFGAGESDIEALLPDLIRRGRDPLVGITASQATITLRITARGGSEQECLGRIEPTKSLIREHLGELVFGEEDDELQHVVARMLRDENKTIALIEAATNGLVSSWLSEQDSDGQVLLGSLVAKVVRANWLSDGASSSPWESLREKNDVRRAAEWARARFAVDFALVVGQVVDGGSDEAAADAIPMAVADSRGAFAALHPIGGHPQIVIPRAAKQALDLVRRRLFRASLESVG